MFDAGLTLFEVQQRLGHKSPTLPANIYTHLMRERFEEGREKLENYMREKRNPAPPSHHQVTQLSSADAHPWFGHANHSGHSSPGWRPSAIAIRSAVSLRTDRFARTRCAFGGRSQFLGKVYDALLASLRASTELDH